MSNTLLPVIDVSQLAAEAVRLERHFPIDSFARVKDNLARPEGVAVADFRFHRAGAYPALEGAVRGRAWLTCQRCMKEFESPFESPVRVAFVGRDAEAGRVPDEYDAVTAPGGRINLTEFVEDELLLALPLVPMHATPAECGLRRPMPVTTKSSASTRSSAKTTRPFQELRSAMKR
jgi:uncharacterized protein